MGKAKAKVGGNQNVGEGPALCPENDKPLKQPSRIGYRYASIYIWLAFFAGICFALHFFAVFRMDLCNGQFMLMNWRTVRNLTLIGFIRSHAWFPCVYALFTLGGVLFMQLRKYPEWAWWLWSAVLCAPFGFYCTVCLYIGGKFIW